MNPVKPIYGVKSSNIIYHQSDGISNMIKKVKDGKIKLTNSQRVSLTYNHDLIKRIPRNEITDHFEFIQSIIPTAMIAGSYRRGNSNSSDIDIVVRQPISDVVSDLKKVGYIKDTISHGNKKFSGVVKLKGYKIHRHIDIVFTTPRAYPFTMLYFTGSKKFNIVMRLKAKKKGLKLNEYGLWNGIVLVGNAKTERDIFKILETPFVHPTSR